MRAVLLAVLTVFASLYLCASGAFAVEVVTKVRLEPNHNPKGEMLGWPAINTAAYESKVYGYSQYSTVTGRDNVVRGAIVSYFTNDHKVDGDTLCLYHTWLNASGKVVLAAAVRAGVKPRTKRLLHSKFEMPLERLRSVTTWRADYRPCGRINDWVVCRSVALGLQITVGAPSEIAYACGKR